MVAIERRKNEKNKMNRAIQHLMIGSALDTLGIFILIYAYSFPEFNPLALNRLPLPLTSLYAVSSLLIIFSMFFLGKGIRVIKYLKSKEPKRTK